jgi:YVTN family beta-propeller protein
MTLDREQVARALPGYDVGDEIGRGGWGVVLRADHRQLGRPVAVKELPRAFAADPSVRRRFVSEARLLATLDHPHIVPIYDYVEEDGLCLLVMELLPGGTLWDRFTTNGVSRDGACSIVVAACSALHYAHGKGILHRDIKPENLLFAASGTLKVSDFGIAKVVGGTASMATRTGEVLGTPAYMAPEQALGAELTAATDVYALGTVLYELLSGRLPFVDDGNAIALLYRHVHELPTPLSEVVPDLPAELVETTMRALAVDPGERYATAEDFGVALADAAGTALGPDWLQRSGIAVMATGRIGARISGPHHLADTEPRPLTPVAGASPAPATVIETTPDRDDAAAHDDRGTELSTIAPDELVPVQDVVAEAAPPAPAAPPAAKRRGRLVVLAIVVVAALVAGGVALSQRGGSSHPPAANPPSSTAAKSAGPVVSATVSVQPHPDHLTFAFGAIFVTENDSKALARIDPTGNHVTQIASFPVAPHAMTATSDALWVTGANSPTIWRVTPGVDAAHTRMTSFSAGTTIAEIAAGAGALWATAPDVSKLLRIDPATSRVIANVTVGGTPDSVAVDSNGVWVANRLTSGTVTRVDPATNTVVATVGVGADPDQLDVGLGAVWVANRDGTISRIDPATNTVVAKVAVGGQPRSVLVGSGAVWASVTSDTFVVRIDPATNKATHTVTAGHKPDHGAAGAGSIWINNDADDTVSRITPGS